MSARDPLLASLRRWADARERRNSPGGHGKTGTALLRDAADEIERLHAALEVIGLPAHVPNGFDPLDWWKHTACKRGEIAREAIGVTAEDLIAKKWHEHVWATR